MKPWQPWVQPRESVRFDENNQLSRGLLWVQLGATGIDGAGGWPSPKLADGLNPVTNGCAIGAGDGVQGKWVSKSGASNVRPAVFRSRRVSQELGKDDKWTVFVIRRTTGTSPSSAGLVTVPYQDGAWGPPFAQLCVRRAGSGDGWQIINGYSGSWQALNFTTSDPPFTDTAWHSLAFTRSGGSFASYKNGVASSTTSGNAGAQASSSASDQEIIIQATGSGFEYTNGETAFVAIWNRALSDAEIRALHSDPYQVLRPAVPMPTFKPASSTTPGNLNAGSYTQTGNSLTATRSLAAALGAGSYSLTGNTITATQAFTAALTAGNYTVTGNDLTALRALTATLGAGSYTVTGYNLTATLSATEANLGAGSYTQTGNDLTGTRSLLLSLDAGSHTVTGYALTANVGLFDADLGAGSYTVTGNSITGLRALRAGLAAGSYAVSGFSIRTGGNPVEKSGALNKFGRMPIGYMVGDQVYPSAAFSVWLDKLLTRTGGVDS